MTISRRETYTCINWTILRDLFLADLPNRERLIPERAPKDHEARKRVKHLVEAITASAECTTLPWSSEEEDEKVAIDMPSFPKLIPFVE